MLPGPVVFPVATSWEHWELKKNKKKTFKIQKIPFQLSQEGDLFLPSKQGRCIFYGRFVDSFLSIQTHTCVRQNALGGGACPERQPVASCPDSPRCRWATGVRAPEWTGSPGGDEFEEMFDGLKAQQKRDQPRLTSHYKGVNSAKGGRSG